MKKLPKELHKKRVLIFIEPLIVDTLTVKECQNIAKNAITKEFKKR